MVKNNEKTKLNVNILYLSTILIFIFETQFFGLQNIEFLNGYNSKGQKVIIDIIIISTIIIMSILSKKYKLMFNNFLIFFLIIVILEIFNSLLKYHYSIKTIIILFNYTILIFSYYIFATFIREKKNKETFLNIIMIFSIINSMVFIVQYLLFSKVGTIINPLQVYMRFNTVRITLSEGFINLAIIISFALLINKKRKKTFFIPLLTFFVCIFELVVVQKTRMAIVCVIVSCLIILLIRYIKNVRKLIFIIACSLILLFISSKTVIFQNYLSTINDPLYQYSADARTGAREFYLAKWEDNFFLGRGFIEGSPNSSTFALLHGINGYFNRTDVGIIGYIDNFGFVGIVWLVLIFLSILRVLYCNRALITANLEIIGLFIYFILTSSTLIVMDPQRIIGLPIFLALIDFFNNESKKRNEYF
ncbi:hypothetical protein [Niallia sp. 03190]|uniref:hypothetical protein n=1 Tax=Niallia sp. 03190 TaxID=3458061 RepID=UPI0040439CBD